MAKDKPLRSPALKWLFILGILTIFACALLRLIFIEVAVVGHNAMAPTLLASDELILWRTQDIALEDVVMCAHPQRPQDWVVGRVVALKGQSLRVTKTQCLQNDNSVGVCGSPTTLSFRDTSRNWEEKVQLKSESVTKPLPEQGYRTFIGVDARIELPKKAIAEGIFLVNDYRSHPNEDSRRFGSIDPASCRGKVIARLRPAPVEQPGIDLDYFAIVR